MSVELTRTFLPVGQGACYLEEFVFSEKQNKTKFVMMYDCGCTSTDWAKKVLKKELENISEIDLLILSHFHEDHVNLLPYLQNLKVNIKNVWIPYFNEEQIKILSYDDHINLDLLNQPKSYLRGLFGDVKVWHIYTPSEGESPNKQEDIHKEEASTPPSENNKNGKDDNQGEIISSKDAFQKLASPILKQIWKYIPYNYDYQRKVNIFKRELAKKGIQWDLLENFPYVAKHQKAIKQCYKNLGSLNEQSLVLFSVPKVSVSCDFLWAGLPYYASPLLWHNFNVDSLWYFLFPTVYRSSSGGCLFWGDYNTKQNWTPELDILFKKYQNVIGTIQVPHHGSLGSFSNKILKPYKQYPMSFGWGNQYRHPSFSVLKKILGQSGLPILVSQTSVYKEKFIIP